MPSPLPKSRFRRVGKWVAIAMCAVIAGLWAIGAVSAERDASGREKRTPRLEVGNYFAAMSNGSIEVGWKNPVPIPVGTAAITGNSYLIPIPLLLLVVLIPTVLVCGLDRHKD